MRFLVGLLSGAAVAVLVAQAADGLGNAGSWRLPAWLDEPANVTGKLPDVPPQPKTGTAEPALPHRRPPEDPADVGHTEAAGFEPANLPIPRPPGSGAPEAPHTTTIAPAPAPARAPASPAVATAADPLPQLEPEAPSAGSQPVWVPFHSRLSAGGFAERLTESLEHPFRVERRGPGAYQVVFGYRDEPHRRNLLAQAAEITGLQL